MYGATIHAYCCLATLIEMKIPPQNIVFIEPFPSEDSKKPRVSIFCNVNVSPDADYFVCISVFFAD